MGGGGGAACTVTDAVAVAEMTGPGPVVAEAVTVLVKLAVTAASEHVYEIVTPGAMNPAVSASALGMPHPGAGPLTPTA